MGPDSMVLSKDKRRRSNHASELFASFRGVASNSFLTDRHISGNTLLAHSPLHEVQRPSQLFSALILICETLK